MTPNTQQHKECQPEQLKPNPTGVVGILHFPDGRPVCSVSDFDTSGYGGFTLHQLQEMRVKSALAREMVNALCSDYIVKALSGYECERMMAALLETGFMTNYVRIGEDRK